MNETLVNKNICKFIDEMMSELNTGFNETFKLLNTENKVIINYPNIELVKGNIPIVPELLNRYKSVNEIFEYENVYKNFLTLDDNILAGINLTDCSISDIKSMSIDLFFNNHLIKSFILDESVIIVTKSGIRESIENIYRSRRQRDYLREHLIIIYNLDKVIQNACLVNQCAEKKGREKYNSWNYYVVHLLISGRLYVLEFEIASMNNGENHYRVQNLYEK